MPDTTPTLRDRIAAALTGVWYQRAAEHTPAAPEEHCAALADAVLAVLPEPPAGLVLGTTDQQPTTAPVATCSAEYHGDEDGARLCIRAAQHTGRAHTDERGYHWSDTVAVYPVADGTFRTGVNLRAALRRLADEAQQPECLASISGSCLPESQSDGACDTEGGECVHGGRPADEAQPATEDAYPTTTTWTVEAQEPNDTWTEWGDHYASNKAHQAAAEFRTTRGAREVRVVRQVVTYTVEPAADQPDTETEAAK